MSCGRISSKYRVFSRAATALVQSRSTTAGNAETLAVLDLEPDARRLPVLRIEKHHIREVDRPLLLDHAADLLRALCAGDLLRTLMALDDVEALDVHPIVPRIHAQDLALLTAILATDHDDFVVRLDACWHQRAPREETD